MRPSVTPIWPRSPKPALPFPGQGEDLIVAAPAEYLICFLRRPRGHQGTLLNPANGCAPMQISLSRSSRRGMLPLCGALRRALRPTGRNAPVGLPDFFNIHIDWLRGVLRGVWPPARCVDTPIPTGWRASAQYIGRRQFRRLGVAAERAGRRCFESALRNIEISAPEHAQRGPPSRPRDCAQSAAQLFAAHCFTASGDPQTLSPMKKMTPT